MDVGHLIVFVGALLLAAGCARPIDAAVYTANTAALSLGETHAAISARRRADQLAAARRVQGDRSNPAVRAEQLDRALEVGRSYRPVWDAYDGARTAWVAAVAAIKVAQAAEERGETPHLGTATRLLMVLADAMREFKEVFPDARPR